MLLNGNTLMNGSIRGNQWDDAWIELRVSLGDGLGTIERRCRVRDCLALADELSKKQEEEEEEEDDEAKKLVEVKRWRDAHGCARWLEDWISRLLLGDEESDALAMFLTARGPEDAAFERMGQKQPRSIRDFLMLGATEHSVRVGRRERRAFSTPVKRGETVYWLQTLAPKKAGLLDQTSDLEFFTGLDAESTVDEVIIAAMGEFEASALSPVESNKDTVLTAEKPLEGEFGGSGGVLFLVWNNESRLSEKRIRLQVARCDPAAVAAATVASAEEYTRREATEDRLTVARRLEGAQSATTLVKCLVVEPIVVSEEAIPLASSPSITGLHIREKLRTHAGFGGTSVKPKKLFSSDEEASQLISTLEEEVRAAEARARSATQAAVVEREKREVERRTSARQREVLAAEKRAAELRSTRAESRLQRAVGGLGLLVELELAEFADRPTNPFRRHLQNKTEEAEAEWALLFQHEDDENTGALDEALRDARQSASSAAKQARELKVAGEEASRLSATLRDEKRLLLAELRRLQKSADDRVAAAKADADEARMVQRQLAAHAKKLKEERRLLARTLSELKAAQEASIADAEETTITPPPPPPPPEAPPVQQTSITGLHVREKIRAAMAAQNNNNNPRTTDNNSSASSSPSPTKKRTTSTPPSRRRRSSDDDAPSSSRTVPWGGVAPPSPTAVNNDAPRTAHVAPPSPIIAVNNGAPRTAHIAPPSPIARVAQTSNNDDKDAPRTSPGGRTIAPPMPTRFSTETSDSNNKSPLKTTVRRSRSGSDDLLPARRAGQLEERRTKLAAKLESCRDRQRALDRVLEQQPDQEVMRDLKLKLDEATRKLQVQLSQLPPPSRAPDDNSGPLAISAETDDAQL